MAVVVFNADVLIAYLGREDAKHAEAVECMRQALWPGIRRLVSAVNYGEVLVGPLRAIGAPGAATVETMVARLGIELVPVDAAMARRASAVHVQTGLGPADAYAVATAVDAEERGATDVQLACFDERVVKAFAELHSRPALGRLDELLADSPAADSTAVLRADRDAR